MTADEVNKCIGLSYGKDANGPNAYNCWTFLEFVERTYFGIDIPFLSLKDTEENAELHRYKLRSGEWQITKEPKHGDGVLLRGGMSPHVGVYIDLEGGGVLHCVEGFGVIFTPKNHLSASGYDQATFYRFNK